MSTDERAGDRLSRIISAGEHENSIQGRVVKTKRSRRIDQLDQVGHGIRPARINITYYDIHSEARWPGGRRRALARPDGTPARPRAHTQRRGRKPRQAAEEPTESTLDLL